MRDRVYVVSDGSDSADIELCNLLADKITKDLNVHARREIPEDHEESLAVVLVGEGVSQIIQAQYAAENGVPCVYFPIDAETGELQHKHGTETFYITSSATGIVSRIREAQELYKKRESSGD